MHSNAVEVPREVKATLGDTFCRNNSAILLLQKALVPYLIALENLDWSSGAYTGNHKISEMIRHYVITLNLHGNIGVTYDELVAKNPRGTHDSLKSHDRYNVIVKLYSGKT